MKRLTGWMAVAILATAAMCGCSKDDGEDKDMTPPQIKMVGADIDAVHEIEDKMSVQVEVAAPAGIKTFSIKIESPALSDALLGMVGLASEMDLVNPATPAMAEALKEFGFPVGEDVAGKKTLSFDISTLIPLIKMLPATASADHVFTLTVGDAKNQTTIKALKFHTTVIAVTYNDDADLWANTASLKVVDLKSTDGVVFEYKVKDAADWQTAPITANTDGSYTVAIAPTWEASKNAAQLDVHTIKAGTGVFAATTYKCRVMNNGKQVAATEFTTDAGNTIENGNMSGWSKKVEQDYDGNNLNITYPNAAGKSFWDSGNNMFLEFPDPNDPIDTPLCREDKTEAGVANLSAQIALGAMLAPGNMFTGDFVFALASFSGSVKFGKPYAWTARPKALKFRYKAQVGVIDRVGPSDPEGETYDGQQDRSRIFVAVVDWATQHGVTSGMIAPTGVWDPTTTKSVTEGAILGYGDLVISQTVDNWTEVTLPLSWYNKTAGKPAAEKFSLVISCATSFRGDYLTGCSTNVLKVDDFEWVY